LKSAGSLIVAVLVADLVFLQTVWTILNWSTTWWLEKKNKQANFCVGCLESLKGGTEWLPAPAGTTTEYLPVPDERPHLRGNVGRASSDSREALVPSL